MPQERELRVGLWRHHRGQLYEVLGVLTCADNGPSDGKEMVYYRPYPSVAGDVMYVRSKDEFLGGTEVNYRGTHKRVYRFEFEGGKPEMRNNSFACSKCMQTLPCRCSDAA